MDSPGVGDDEPPDEDSVTEESPDDEVTAESGTDESPGEPLPEEPPADKYTDDSEPAGGDDQPSPADAFSEQDVADRAPDDRLNQSVSLSGETWSDSADESRRESGPDTTGRQSDDSPTYRARETGSDGTNGRDSNAETDGRSEWVTFAFDIVSSVFAVLVVGALLFAVSGVWPPMVAVESPSMTPHMQTGDLVFVMDENRFSGEGAHAGVVTARTGSTVEYTKFGRPGDVIVYNPDGNGDRTPIIHRAMFWVDKGENWYERADRQSIGRYSECGETPDEALPNCPAPHGGFVTKGDANGVYDQAQGTTGLSTPVKPAWVVGTAELRVPLLGCIRLRSEGCLALTTESAIAQPTVGETNSVTDEATSPVHGQPTQLIAQNETHLEGLRKRDPGDASASL